MMELEIKLRILLKLAKTAFRCDPANNSTEVRDQQIRN